MDPYADRWKKHSAWNIWMCLKSMDKHSCYATEMLLFQRESDDSQTVLFLAPIDIKRSTIIYWPPLYTVACSNSTVLVFISTAKASKPSWDHWKEWPLQPWSIQLVPDGSWWLMIVYGCSISIIIVGFTAGVLTRGTSPSLSLRLGSQLSLWQ